MVDKGNSIQGFTTGGKPFGGDSAGQNKMKIYNKIC